MSWLCRACGLENRDADLNCMKCGGATAMFRGTQVREKPEAPPAPSGTLPAYLAGARFVTNQAWTSGALYAVEQGFFLLSVEDGIAVEDKAASRKIPPGDEVRVASKSQWIPVKAIKRVVHSQVTGHKIELQGAAAPVPIPIRFDNEGWATLQAICTQLHLEFVT